MQELENILKKYDPAKTETRFGEQLKTLEGINQFALTFYKDVADIYDCVTRIKNPTRNPTGFSLNDAPILGLLVRIWKLLKEVIRYYELDNVEIIGILERPILEASVMASYLMTSDPSVMEDYRKCSYKDRLRILRDLENGSPFFETKPGQRLLKSIREKMEFEGLVASDFEGQKKNRWRVQGKSFYDIFSIVEQSSIYPSTYGMMSESIHGSWNEMMDWDLRRNTDGTFSTFPGYCPADIRYVTPLLQFTNRPFRLWLDRVEIADTELTKVLDWIERVNALLYVSFDEKFSE